VFLVRDSREAKTMPPSVPMRKACKKRVLVVLGMAGVSFLHIFVSLMRMERKIEQMTDNFGEPGVPSLAPAVTNAFFNAAGVRVGCLPLTDL
jgi:hypothetical protein